MLSKRGRPSIWKLPLRNGDLPEKYFDKLKEIALKWQEEEFNAIYSGKN